MQEKPEKIEELKFDVALQRLEALVHNLENGNLSLEESMTAFDEGMKLNKFCAGKLAEAEKKIEVLMRNASGEWEWQAQSQKTENS